MSLNIIVDVALKNNQQQQQQQQQSGQQQQSQAGQRGGVGGGGTSVADQAVTLMKNHVIYVNTHCAFLKLLSSFSGSDYYELLNSINAPPNNKHGPKYFVNSESEEINKALVMVIARAVQLTSSRMCIIF